MQLREIGEVVLGERLGIAEVRVNAAQSAQAARARAHPAPVRHGEPAVSAAHHVGDRAAPVEQHAHHAPYLVRELGELTRQFVGHQPIGRDAPPPQPLEPLHMTGFEPARISFNAQLDQSPPPLVDPDGTRSLPP